MIPFGQLTNENIFDAGSADAKYVSRVYSKIYDELTYWEDPGYPKGYSRPTNFFDAETLRAPGSTEMHRSTAIQASVLSGRGFSIQADELSHEDYQPENLNKFNYERDPVRLAAGQGVNTPTPMTDAEIAQDEFLKKNPEMLRKGYRERPYFSERVSALNEKLVGEPSDIFVQNIGFDSARQFDVMQADESYEFIKNLEGVEVRPSARKGYAPKFFISDSDIDVRTAKGKASEKYASYRVSGSKEAWDSTLDAFVDVGDKWVDALGKTPTPGKSRTMDIMTLSKSNLAVYNKLAQKLNLPTGTGFGGTSMEYISDLLLGEAERHHASADTPLEKLATVNALGSRAFMKKVGADLESGALTPESAKIMASGENLIGRPYSPEFLEYSDKFRRSVGHYKTITERVNKVGKVQKELSILQRIHDFDKYYESDQPMTRHSKNDTGMDRATRRISNYFVDEYTQTPGVTKGPLYVTPDILPDDLVTASNMDHDDLVRAGAREAEHVNRNFKNRNMINTTYTGGEDKPISNIIFEGTNAGGRSGVPAINQDLTLPTSMKERVSRAIFEQELSDVRFTDPDLYDNLRSRESEFLDFGKMRPEDKVAMHGKIEELSGIKKNIIQSNTFVNQEAKAGVANEDILKRLARSAPSSTDPVEGLFDKFVNRMARPGVAGLAIGAGFVAMGLRQSFASNPSEFEVMMPKGIEESDFIGGRDQTNRHSYSQSKKLTSMNPIELIEETFHELGNAIRGTKRIVSGLEEYDKAKGWGVSANVRKVGKLGPYAALAGLAYLSYSLMSDSQDEWGRASGYAVADQYMMKSVTSYDEEMSPRSQKIVDHGTYIHAGLQSALMQSMPNAYAEYTVKNKKLKMTGHIDMMMPMMIGGKKHVIPVEIKTIGEKALEKMTAPKPYHRGQAQFYLHESGAPFEKFIYVAREDPTKYKIFDVKRSEKEFQYWYHRFKNYQVKAKDQGFDLAGGPNHLEIAWDQMKQPDFNSMRRTGMMKNHEVNELIGNAIRSTHLAPFSTGSTEWSSGFAVNYSGINRSSQDSSDFNSGATHDKNGDHKIRVNEHSRKVAEGNTAEKRSRVKRKVGIIKCRKASKISDHRAKSGIGYKKAARSRHDNYTSRGANLVNA